MSTLLLILLILLVGGPLSFALARIAIRLQQEPGLAALTSVLIFWQLIALTAGRAALASSMMLLIGVSALLILTHWLLSVSVLGAWVRWGLFVLAGLAWAMAATYPILQPVQALAFSASFIAAAAGTGCAIYWARTPVSLGKLGLPALGLLGLWLIVRAAASFVAAVQ